MNLRLVCVALVGLAAPGVVLGQGHFRLAAHYAPVIYQDVVCTKYGDYITRIDFDGDYVGNNNWDNLGNPRDWSDVDLPVDLDEATDPSAWIEATDPSNWRQYLYPTKARRLPAHVYYSVVETTTHYFITYALFHPADDYHCHFDQHENDLEGIILTVRKDGTPFGELRLVQLQAHWDFYQYTPAGATGLSDGESSIDGSITIEADGRPRVYVEGGGHGIRSEDTGGAPSVIYRYGPIAEDPDEVGYASVRYDLLSILAEMWERRDDCCGAGHLFAKRGNYAGHRGFTVEGIGRKFDGNDGGDDAASTPWHWEDSGLLGVVGDDEPWNKGDWFMDPAGYQAWQFNWSESFATQYLVHPFLSDHLPDEIYNGHNGTTTLTKGSYEVVRTSTVLTGQELHLQPGRTMAFRPATALRSDGTVRVSGESSTTVLHRVDRPDISIIVQGELLMHAGGAIQFP